MSEGTRSAVALKASLEWERANAARRDAQWRARLEFFQHENQVLRHLLVARERALQDLARRVPPRVQPVDTDFSAATLTTEEL